MKISDSSHLNEMLQKVAQANSTDPADKSRTAQKDTEKSPAGDKVEFSQRSKDLQKIHETLQSTPDSRAAKVAEIRQRIEQGQYQVDSKTLAEKIIKESILELIK